MISSHVKISGTSSVKIEESGLGESSDRDGRIYRLG